MKEEAAGRDDRAANHTQERPPQNESKIHEEVERKPIRKKDKGGDRMREKSSRSSDREENKGKIRVDSSKRVRNERKEHTEKTREDSSKRVEFMEDESGERKDAALEDDRGKTSDGADEEDRVNEGESSPIKARPPRPKSAKGIRGSKKPMPRASSTKREVVPEPIQNFVPQITVPVPFKFATRKPIVNKYSTKFVEEMVMKKKQEQEEEEFQASKPKPQFEDGSLQLCAGTLSKKHCTDDLRA
ncbi:hypothetical protein TELCIR_09516 [Teladorsagia circumcincta]|uniref:Uncharacterized protein n=1 Tax=Teladorsagia circumcincta TaxID=45464 RepID=A0A2G9UEJ5_TELCI|nr:hypothetical protein TELCIR_09516 [Teladorsagia circumcincta]